MDGLQRLYQGFARLRRAVRQAEMGLR